MKKVLIISALLTLPGLAVAQTANLGALENVQNRNDNMRDAAIAQQQANYAAAQRREEARRNEVARSVAARNRAKAAAIAEQQKYVHDNQDIDLAERRLKLQHDQVRGQHDEEFVKGELDRQKAINNQINQGKTTLNIGPVDAD